MVLVYLQKISDTLASNGKELLKTQEKYYLSDIGLRTYLLGNTLNKDLGHILENIIFLEIKRRGYNIYIGKDNDN